MRKSEVQINVAMSGIERATTKVRNFGNVIKGATRNDGVADMAANFDKVFKAADTAGGKLQGLGSIAASFGGPWGIAIASVTSAITLAADKWDLFGDKAKKAMADIEKEAKAWKTKLEILRIEDAVFGTDNAAKRDVEHDIEQITKSVEEADKKIEDANESLESSWDSALRVVKAVLSSPFYSKGVSVGDIIDDQEKRIQTDINKATDERSKKLDELKAKYEELKKIQEAPKDREVDPNGYMDKMFGKGMEAPTIETNLKIKGIQLPTENKLEQLMSIDPTSLNTLAMFNDYIKQMNEELQKADINSEVYTKISEKIALAKDKQNELNGSTQDTSKQYQATAEFIGAASTSLDAFADESNMAAQAQKMLAIAEQAAALASAIHSAASGGDPYTVAPRIAAAVAAVVAGFASMAKFADGGIVGGGYGVGDRQMVRVNGGEMILNGSQQKNLFNLLDHGGSNGQQGGNMTFRISGKDLIGVMDNYNTTRNRLK